MCPRRSLPRAVKTQGRAGGGGTFGAQSVHARHPLVRGIPVDQPLPHRANRMVNRGRYGECTCHLGPPLVSRVSCSPRRGRCALDRLHLARPHLVWGTKPADAAASMRSYADRWAAAYSEGVTPLWRLKSRIRCAWSNHPNSLAQFAHATDSYTSMWSSRRRNRRMRASVRGLRPTCPLNCLSRWPWLTPSPAAISATGRAGSAESASTAAARLRGVRAMRQHIVDNKLLMAETHRREGSRL